MMNENQIRERVNRRLSGLDASDRRRAAILAAVDAEREAAFPIKRKISVRLVLAILAILLMASLAIADGLNLFAVFGSRDERYAGVADQAARIAALPVEVEDESLGLVTAVIDSVYFDGMTLNVAFQVEHGIWYEAFTPTAEQMAEMDAEQPMPAALDPNAPGAEILQAYNHALQTGKPFGYRCVSVYSGDHTLTDDGIDIPPYSADSFYTADGAYCEMREFVTPLPAELASRDCLNLTIGLYQQESLVYFDGEKAYGLYTRSQAGQLTASVPRTANAIRSMAGSGMINGVMCEAEAEVSQMAATVMLTAGAPFSRFLQAPPEGVEPADCWVEMIAFDEMGRVWRPQSGSGIDDRTEAEISLLGTGSLPETLTIYVYTTWEGEGAPTHEGMTGIVMTIANP